MRRYVGKGWFLKVTDKPSYYCPRVKRFYFPSRGWKQGHKLAHGKYAKTIPKKRQGPVYNKAYFVY